jgi:hypothetical protein
MSRVECNTAIYASLLIYCESELLDFTVFDSKCLIVMGHMMLYCSGDSLFSKICRLPIYCMISSFEAAIVCEEILATIFVHI